VDFKHLKILGESVDDFPVTGFLICQVIKNEEVSCPRASKPNLRMVNGYQSAGCKLAGEEATMSKNSMSASEPVQKRYSDLETDVPPELPELPFLPNTDPAILRLAVKKALPKNVSEGQGQLDGNRPRPTSVSH
jgi:hypothetical protein